MHDSLSVPIKNYRSKNLSTINLLILLTIHIALAFIERAYPIISTLHALITLSIGILIAFFSKNPKNIVVITAYIVGAEILWRMTGASVFWEFGKYAILVILLIGFFRLKHVRRSYLSVIYFILLCISIPLTIFSRGLTETARELISFNLSGPLALTVCVLYFSQTRLDISELQDTAWAMTIPLFSVLSLALYNTVTVEKIVFTSESNYLTSGGFGPNQVSAVLGLGAVMMFLVMISTPKKSHRLLAMVFMLTFIVQSSLTFSRGGLYNTAACILVGSVHLLRLRKGKTKIIILLFTISIIGIYFLYPQIDQFTGGKLTQRFQDTDTTGRIKLAQIDLLIWQNNQFFGVGPGEASYTVGQVYGRNIAAHTEYTRLLAEHGLFGILAIILLLVMSSKAYVNSPNWYSKMWVSVFLVWSLVEMSHAAMRIASISFLFGIANSIWIVPKRNENSETNRNETVTNSISNKSLSNKRTYEENF